LSDHAQIPVRALLGIPQVDPANPLLTVKDLVQSFGLAGPKSNRLTLERLADSNLGFLKLD